MPQSHDNIVDIEELYALIPVEFQPTPARKGVLAGKHLGPRTVAKLAHDAGFRDDNLFMAVTICGAESWMDTGAYNDNETPRTRDVGLWQINIPGDQIGTGAEQILYDPAHNAAAAFRLWQNRGWQPWVAYTGKTYLHDTYRLWGYLGAANRWEELVSQAAENNNIATRIPVPALSIPIARNIWRGVPLG